jgi:hypothetical protein
MTQAIPPVANAFYAVASSAAAKIEELEARIAELQKLCEVYAERLWKTEGEKANLQAEVERLRRERDTWHAIGKG